MSEYTRRRSIRSFVVRSARMTEAQKRALEEHWPRWGLEKSAGPFDARAIFGNNHPLVLEVGFGMGQSLAATAAANPDTNYLGIEVHRPGVGRLLHTMATEGIDNLRVYCDDAVEILQDCIAPDSLDRVQIFFPDPWQKKRHHKRRLIQPDFAALVVGRLKPGGTLHLATDWENYAEHILEVLNAEPALVNAAPDNGYCLQPPPRPQTRFEQRGQSLGHGVWDLLFRRR